MRAVCRQADVCDNIRLLGVAREGSAAGCKGNLRALAREREIRAIESTYDRDRVAGLDDALVQHWSESLAHVTAARGGSVGGRSVSELLRRHTFACLWPT